MTRTRIKICGLTRPEDALVAVEAGADAIGVVLAPSKRRLSLDDAARVFAVVPPPVARVGVFVDATCEEIAEAVSRLGLSAVQLHGGESASDCLEAAAPAIKAFRVRPGDDLGRFAALYRDRAAALLFDTYDERAMGGTGATFDWSLATALPTGTRWFLAGGLTPDNVAAAVRVARPFAVDVSSGVEDAPGIKNAEKIRAFVSAVRRADEEVYG